MPCRTAMGRPSPSAVSTLTGLPMLFTAGARMKTQCSGSPSISTNTKPASKLSTWRPEALRLTSYPLGAAARDACASACLPLLSSPYRHPRAGIPAQAFTRRHSRAGAPYRHVLSRPLPQRAVKAVHVNWLHNCRALAAGNNQPVNLVKLIRQPNFGRGDVQAA